MQEGLLGARWIKGFEGYYMISPEGELISVHRVVIKRNGNKHTVRSRIIKGVPDDNGYLKVVLYITNKIRWVVALHRLVAEAFIPNPLNLPQVNHKFGIKEDCRASELEWVTQAENMDHAREVLGLYSNDTLKIPVNQLTKNGELVKKWKSMAEARDSKGFDDTSISRCCAKKKGWVTHKGFKWEYAEC